MGLSNKQRLMIMRKAKEMNYQGSLLDLFKEAEAGGFANDVNKPKKSTYVDARSGYGFPTTYQDGGINKENIESDVLSSTETISRRHGLDSMPNSLQSFLSKNHQLSRSDMEIDDTVKMMDGGLASTSTDDEGKLIRNIMMEQVASTGRDTTNLNMSMNAIGQHESNNDILSIQVSGNKEKGFFDGPGRGKYQYETDQGSNSGNTAVNRLYNFFIDVKKETKETIESKYPNFFNQYKKKSANFAELGEDMQDALFIADNIYGGKDRADAFNTMTTKKDLSSMDIFRFWLKNHKKKVDGVLANKLDKSTIDKEFKKWSDRTKSIFEVPEPEAVDKKEDGGVNEEDIQYGPYMLPEVTIEPEAQLSMPPLEGQGRAESTMSPIELLLGAAITRSPKLLSPLGVTDLLLNPFISLKSLADKGVSITADLIKKRKQVQYMYRGLGPEGYKDAIKSNVLRGRQTPNVNMVGEFNLGKTFSNKTYYSPKKEIAKKYGKGYYARVPVEEFEGKLINRYGSDNTWSQYTKSQIPTNKAEIFKPLFGEYGGPSIKSPKKKGGYKPIKKYR